MGASALSAGFVRNEVALIVLRAFMGISASLTIPAALHLIVHLFPDPAGQAKAVAVFAGTGAIGNVTGLIIGAALVSFASWRWVFYFIAIIGISIAVPVGLLVPEKYNRGEGHGAMSAMVSWQKLRKLDTFGVGTVTVALALFIYAVTTGSIEGWGSAKTAEDVEINKLLDPHRRVSANVYLGGGPCNFLWQEVYEWSTISTAVHLLPIGIVSAPFMFTSGYFTQLFPLKYVMLCGQVLLLDGSILLPFANSPAHYWPLAFPAMCIGTAGNTIIFATVNIALFAETPPSVAGTVGAIWNSSLQARPGKGGPPGGVRGTGGGVLVLVRDGGMGKKGKDGEGVAQKEAKDLESAATTVSFMLQDAEASKYFY
ncbi:MFS general substrate transporter [Rickenella mellea]|uniref:MFS general substrate transporter n=1 Tax=Rickenella mellea TaxID=50990 RepID=A0A4Y7Q2U4_9AGAM|nr:MFS general substrate transporter [Rickenella mellea]